MHAVSPQLMVWDPSSVGMPMHAPDIQAPLLSSTGYPTVIPSHAYRSPDALPQIFTGPAVQNTADPQGVVWIQSTNVVPQDEGDNTVITPGFAPGQLPVHPHHHGMVPVLVNVNGQRLILNHPMHHISATHQPTFCQIATDHAQHETVRLINVTGINQNNQHVPQLNSLPQDLRSTLQVSPIQEKQANSYGRPRLTPKRRSGTTNSVCDAAVTWRKVSDERTLGGLNAALRRRSQSAEHDVNCANTQNSPSGSPSPNKRLAPTITNLERQNELWRGPDSRLLKKLVDIIEYYFSDECLSKNGYMLKQLSNGECDGYISLRRVAALKRVKSQTRDLRTVANAVRQSTKLEMDEEGTMIRRKRPLPENIEAPRFIRSVLAINLPKSTPSVEDVTSLFTPYGELTQVRVLRPGKAIPTYLKDYTAWVPDLGTRVCAVVEFENQDEAQKACREINMQNRGPNCLRVALLKPGARIRRTLYRKYKGDQPEGNTESGDFTSSDKLDSEAPRARSLSDSSNDENQDENRRSQSTPTESNNNMNNNNNPHFHYDASASGSDTESTGSKSGNGLSSPVKTDDSNAGIASGDSGYNQSSSSDERDSMALSPNMNRNSEIAKSDTDSVSPLRRMSPQMQKKFIDGVPIGVKRQPKGPVLDSKGFLTQRPALT